MKHNRTFDVALILFFTLFLCLLILAVRAYAISWTPRQSKAHEIAEMARDMGLSEDDPIIVRASEIWWEDANAKAYITDWPENPQSMEVRKDGLETRGS